MAAVVGNLHHNVSTDVVGLLWVVSYVGIRRVVYQTLGDCLPNKVRKSIPVGIGAVGSAASMPNRPVCRVCRFGSSWGNDALRQWCQIRQNRGRRRLFQQHVNSHIN